MYIPPGDEFRKTLKQKIKDRDSVDLWRVEPTAATLNRFLLSFPREIKDYPENGLEEGYLRESMEMFHESPYLRKAVETRDYLGAILEVQVAKKRVKMPDPEEWAYGEELGLLMNWKPGFELILTKEFYEERCGECWRDERIDRGCQEGLFNCPYDGEYEEYLRESVQRVVGKLQQGMDPKDIPELEVPEFQKIREEYTKILYNR
jgi:hypothetical protein